MDTGTLSFSILDGGMGRLLERLGAPFRLPEWSALSLIEAPEFVTRAHQAYVDSGADIITTNSYGLVPHMLGEERFASHGKTLADLAGRLARDVASSAGRKVLVAGSLPPLFESYRPDRFQSGEAPRILQSLVDGLRPHIDFWLIETQSSTIEALTAIAAVKDLGLPVYVSYTLKDETGRVGPAELRSGEPAGEAARKTLEAGASGVFFNCSQPEVMSEAVLAARRVIDDARIPVGVYANAFLPEPPSDEPYAGISEIREDLGPGNYLKWVDRWIGQGATVVGGCCGIGPEHIEAIRAFRDGRAANSAPRSNI
ncbi:homocysteine S-methyltransferase family protein [Mesorhizobium sp.]|uniref:homocysteine S-methyltransferase family protein n=1 Tax=Mesorhizobium sp. TaxID=1871066 RepID=UPI000FE8751D|nr:homocysteine S-methyltransferase family protein [Mesorhizobium sp.]RWD94359.1 MAG: homocysteine S-methyltransferase family protein [Mesorhizobium sp.]